MKTDPERAPPVPAPRFPARTVCAVLVVAAVLRSSFAEVTYFTADQTRDVTAARHILHGELTAEGPAIGQTGFHLGPLHYYVVALGLLVRDDPVDAIRLFGLLNAAGVAAYAFLFHRLAGARAALLAGLVLALHPLSILHGRGLWNPALILPTTAIYLLGLWLWIGERRRGGLTLALIGVALMLQVHATTVLLLPLALAAFTRRVPWRGPGPLAAGLGFLGLTVPWLVANFRAGPDRLENLAALFRPAGAVAGYGAATLRALAVETVLPDRTLFGGGLWNGIVVAAAVLFTVLVVLGGAALAAGLRGVGRPKALLLLPALALPCLLVPLVRHGAFYYYLELTLPLRALCAVLGTAVLARRLGAWLAGAALAAAIGIGFLHVVGGLRLDASDGRLRGHLTPMDLRAVRPAREPANAFPTLASKIAVCRTLARRFGVTAANLGRRGRGPWWPAFVDDGGFWLEEYRRRRVAGPRTPLPPGACLFIRHDEDPFRAPAGRQRLAEARAGSFRVILFRSGFARRAMEIAVPRPGRKPAWHLLPENLARSQWPAREVLVRLPLALPRPPPAHLTVQLTSAFGARALRVAADGRPLRTTGSWERLGVRLEAFTWNHPPPGVHRVEVRLRSPANRAYPVFFELNDVWE